MPVPPVVLQAPPRSNQYYIAAAIIASFIIWIFFKIIYPYPFITIDSYYYIGAAYEKANAGSWPIGYSKFIRFVGYISHSHILLVTVQYLLLQAAFLYFFLTTRLIFKLGKWTSLILFLFLFVNPLFIFASNHIMSDILFCSLSLCWVCQLLWIVKRPQTYMIFIQAILLAAIFTIRYTALYFPLFTIIAFLYSRQLIWRKVTGIGLTFLLLGCFIQFTRIKMAEIAGIRQFSSASGWKQASNALYMYEHISAIDKTEVPEEFKVLHQLTKIYFQGPHTPVDLFHIDQEFTTGSFYVAAYESPLMQYLRLKQGTNANVFDFKNIAPFGPLFGAYGNFLILHHPIAYLQYVVLPDMAAYLSPFPEIYGTPNDLYFLWENQLGEMTKIWFGLTDVRIPAERIKMRGVILSPYPTIFSITHIVFLLSLIIFILYKYYQKEDKITKYSFLLLTAICILNYIFTILTAASVLRFQFTFIILEFALVTYVINNIYRNTPSNDGQNLSTHK
jgi:hypothetical protein